jgi:hypothetical protein
MNLFEMFSEQKELTLIDAMRDFLPIAIKHLKLKSLPKIELERNLYHTHVPTFGRFVNEEQTIYLDIENRHPVDIIRTLAHELVHFDQGQEHELSSGSWHTGSPIEDEANAEAGVMMRIFDEQFPQYLKMKPVELPDVGPEETHDGDSFFESYGEIEETLEEAVYHGRTVTLNKPMQGDVKKFKVYVKDPKTGNIKKVNFGDPNMRIKKSNPKRRKSFRARHHCDNPGPKTKARYWSCRKW